MVLVTEYESQHWLVHRMPLTKLWLKQVISL